MQVYKSFENGHAQMVLIDLRTWFIAEYKKKSSNFILVYQNNPPAQFLHATNVGTWDFKHPADKLSVSTSAWHFLAIDIFKADST